jgi:hypothetical protein
MIPGFNTFDILADAFDYAGAFVSKHHSVGKTAFTKINIHVANPAGDQTHQYFIGAWPFHLQALDFQRPARLP